MAVSENRDTPKSSILIRFSIINHPFWGTPIFGNIHIYIYLCLHSHPIHHWFSQSEVDSTPGANVVVIGDPITWFNGFLVLRKLIHVF